MARGDGSARSHAARPADRTAHGRRLPSLVTRRRKIAFSGVSTAPVSSRRSPSSTPTAAESPISAPLVSAPPGRATTQSSCTPRRLTPSASPVATRRIASESREPETDSPETAASRRRNAPRVAPAPPRQSNHRIVRRPHPQQRSDGSRRHQLSSPRERTRRRDESSARLPPTECLSAGSSAGPVLGIVARRSTSAGTNTGELFGQPPTGKPMSITELEIVRFQDGKIIYLRNAFDSQTLAAQLTS
jgi:hypothetical protein